MTIETKFAPMDEVWILEGRKAVLAKIDRVDICLTLRGVVEECTVKVNGTHQAFSTDHLFPTKQALLESL